MADYGNVAGAVALAQAGLIVGEGDVEQPVEAVFDRPVAADRRGPSMATSPTLSGQLSRTHPAKAAANSAGLIRFIRMVSQRSPGTPFS